MRYEKCVSWHGRIRKAGPSVGGIRLIQRHVRTALIVRVVDIARCQIGTRYSHAGCI